MEPAHQPNFTWKTFFLVALILVWILTFGQIVFNTRFERLGWAVSLLPLWMLTARQIVKPAWGVRKIFQTLSLAGYTFFAIGHLLSPGTAAAWLTGIGALLMIGNGILTMFYFHELCKPVSADTAPPAA